MMRSLVAVGVLGFVGLFGYFFVTNSTDMSGTEKAKDAIARVGDKVLDEGLASAVAVRLKGEFGLGATRFLHVHHDEGTVTVYGLAPADITVERLETLARGIPGVKNVQILLQSLPEYLLANATAKRPAPQATP